MPKVVEEKKPLENLKKENVAIKVEIKQNQNPEVKTQQPVSKVKPIQIKQQQNQNLKQPKKLKSPKKDWIDFFIYISNQYTFFQDLCKKHTDINNALKEFKSKLYEDYKVLIRNNYSKNNQPTIDAFMIKSISDITSKFLEIYQDPNATCSCESILKRIKEKEIRSNYEKTIKNTCPNEPIKPSKPKEIQPPIEKEENEEPSNSIDIQRPIKNNI
jgi:hypothetical protein